MVLDKAFFYLREGEKIRRQSWNRIKYIVKVMRNNKRLAIIAREDNFDYPYSFSNIDLFADDWEVVEV